MTNFVRKAALAVSVAAVAFAAPAVAAPTSATPPATANVTIMKPLTLVANRNLDFGTVLLGSALTGGENVTMTDAGAVTCSANTTCSGSPQSAQYTVTGVRNQFIAITTLGSTLTNATGATIAFTPNSHANVQLSNDAAAAAVFTLGGSISVSGATDDGVYSGNMNVTVDYN